MGNDKKKDERPRHSEGLQSFLIDVTEVTVPAYARCVSKKGCPPPTSPSGWCNYDPRDRTKHPMNCVTWQEAVTYCAWVGKRLPTEAEWECAASERGTREYPWGDKMVPDQLCWKRSASDRTCEVGHFPDDRFVLKDMVGNVWEWVSDLWCNCYDRQACDVTSSSRVIRGGSWDGGNATLVRARMRSFSLPETRTPFLGFRCAVSVTAK